MRAKLPLLLSTLALLGVAPVAAQGPTLSVGGLVGYENGTAIQAFGTVRGLAEGIPWAVRLRLGHTAVSPGSPTLARRVFVNQATNGTPSASGRTWDGGLDVLLPRGPRTRIYAGLRHSSFMADFVFIGGNEDFEVRSSHWGVASGFEGGFPMARKLDLLLSAGAEYYLSSRIAGHDTSYSPSNQNVNPREDFTYADADEAVGQPKLRLALLVGVSYRLGR
jgi:hypothetical protein